MTIDQANYLENSATKAWQRLIHECLTFQSAQLYLLKINVSALEGSPDVKEAHESFLQQLKPYYESPYRYFVGRSFISLVASFELFMQDIVTAVVLSNPKKVGNVEFKLTEILDASDTEELVRRSIEVSFNKLMYKKPSEYLSEVSVLLSIDQGPLIPKWPIFVEAKARRDLGVHNGWQCNSTYLRKVKDTGLIPSITEGDSGFPVDDKYLYQVGVTLMELASLITDAVFVKHLKKSSLLQL